MRVEQESRKNLPQNNPGPSNLPLYVCPSNCGCYSSLEESGRLVWWAGIHGRTVFCDDLGPKPRLDGIVHFFIQCPVPVSRTEYRQQPRLANRRHLNLRENSFPRNTFWSRRRTSGMTEFLCIVNIVLHCRTRVVTSSGSLSVTHPAWRTAATKAVTDARRLSDDRNRATCLPTGSRLMSVSSSPVASSTAVVSRKVNFRSRIKHCVSSRSKDNVSLPANSATIFVDKRANRGICEGSVQTTLFVDLIEAVF